MKLKVFIYSALSLLLMASCGSASKNETETDADSVAQQMEEPSLETETVTYNSPDLKKIGLFGPVKTVTLGDYEGKWVGAAPLAEMFDENRKLSFTETGALETPVPDNITFKTNHAGFIDNLSIAESDSNINYIFTLNEKGWPVSAEYVIEGPYDDEPINYSYSYPETDKYGNWTKCTIKRGFEEGSLTRTITYY